MRRREDKWVTYLYNGEEMEVESAESSEQTVCEESLSSAEPEVSGDKTNYKLVIK